MKNMAWIKAPPLWTFLAMVTLWQALVSLGDFPVYILPSPLVVLNAVFQKSDQLLMATVNTGLASLMGLCLSLVVGYLVALIFSLSSWLEKGLYPYAVFFQTVPIVAIAPLIVLWVGHGFAGVMIVALILSVFPIIASATLGLSRIPQAWLELFRLHHANRWKCLWYLQIPHSISYVWSGLRVSCGLSVIGAIVGEFSAGYGGEDYGLGYLILFSSGQLKTDLLFASIFFSTLLGWGLFSLIDHGGEWLLNHYHMKDKRMEK
jgi:NitT/TauT family transport system permease protein